VLCALCAGVSDSGGLTISGAKALLEKYVWQGPDNRVVFECLCGLSSGVSGGQLREQLPAQATRLGFPDVEWGDYLRPVGVAGDLRVGISELLAMD